MTATDCTCTGGAVGVRVMLARATGDSPHTEGCPRRALTREDLQRLQALLAGSSCDLGRYEYDMARYCHTHGGFVNYMQDRPVCDQHPARQDPAWPLLRPVGTR